MTSQESSSSNLAQATLEKRRQQGRNKRARTRLKLLQAAYELLEEPAGRDMQVDDVIRQAGVSRGTFYNYFEDMSEVFDALSFELNHGLDEALPNRASPTAWASDAIRIYLHRVRRDPAWGWVMLNISLKGPVALGRDTYEHAQTTLREGMQSGDFSIDSLEAGMDIVMGTTVMAILRLLTEAPAPEFPEQVAQSILLALGVSKNKARKATSSPLPELMPDVPTFKTSAELGEQSKSA